LRRAALFFDLPRPAPVAAARLPDLRCRFDAFFAFDDLDLPFFVGMLFLSHVFTFSRF